MEIQYLWSMTSAAVDPINKMDPQYHKVHQLTDEVQDEWEKVLLTAPIARIVSEGYAGLATKYLTVFETGHLAIAKVVQPFSLVDHDWETITVEDISRYTAKDTSYSRSGRKFQAWTEVAAYIVSRIAFPVARKPPAMLRAIPSSMLYQCEGCNSWREYFYSWLPEHTVYISVHAFLSDMKIAAPSTVLYEYLVHLPNVHKLDTTRHSIKEASLVSDIVIYDFLLDDHDRKRGHNWMKGPDGQYILWDSGLSFQHGPAGKHCTTLFCGPEKWQDHGTNVHDLKRCQKICRFRKETIERLKSLSIASNIATPENTLGEYVRRKVESIDTPIFEWNLYYQFSQGYPKVKFVTGDFYNGLNTKLTELLDHVSTCENIYGEDIWIDEDVNDARRA